MNAPELLKDLIESDCETSSEGCPHHYGPSPDAPEYCWPCRARALDDHSTEEETIASLLVQTIEMNRWDHFWSRLKGLPVSKFIGPLKKILAERVERPETWDSSRDHDGQHIKCPHCSYAFNREVDDVAAIEKHIDACKDTT